MAVPLGLVDGQPGDAQRMKRILNIIELEGLDDSNNEFHDYVSPWRVWPKGPPKTVLLEHSNRHHH
jgi:hypothetical protein